MAVKESEPTQTERELIDSLDRVGRDPDEHSAVHIHLSKLQASNKTPIKLKVASRFFGMLQQSYEMSVFVMSNGDLIVMGFDLPETEIVRVIERLKALFDGDPLLIAPTPQKFGILQEPQTSDRFATWYALEVEFDEFLKVARDLLVEAEVLLKALRAAPPAIKQAGPGDMAEIVDHLEKVDLGPMIRRQACLQFVASEIEGGLDSVAQILFEEFYVSMSDVQKASADGLDILSDRWLFQYFTRAVDEAILFTLPSTAAYKIPKRISLNLNLLTLQGQRFSNLLENFGPNKSLIIEVQLIDVLANLKTYYKARDGLREAGHTLLIDGLSSAAIASLNLGMLAPDMIKVVWSPDMAGGEGSASFTNKLGGYPMNHIILSRASTDVAIRWGRSQGILGFQGMWVDAALASMTMLRCPAAAQCTMKQCEQRRSSVIIRKRRECPNPPGLDMVQSFAAPSQKRYPPGHFAGQPKPERRVDPNRQPGPSPQRGGQ